MKIKQTIQTMQNGLPNPIPDLLSQQQSGVVASCVIALKDIASQGTMAKGLMKLTSITTTHGNSNMLDYLSNIDDRDCMASTAKDLVEFKKALPFG
jgi:hypothetical protein